jgi:hypothetical protein
VASMADFREEYQPIQLEDGRMIHRAKRVVLPDIIHFRDACF